MSDPAPHSSHPLLRAQGLRLLLLGLAIFVAIQGVVSVGWRQGDIQWHYWLGQSMLDRGQWQRFTPTYTVNDTHIGSAILSRHYLLGRMVFNTGLALLPYPAARLLSYALGVAGLIASFYIWRRFVPHLTPAQRQMSLAAGIGAILLLLPWMVRELDECGPQLLLLFFLSAALLAIHRRQAAIAGFWLGLALAWKSSPLLFLPFLLWKRRWREAGWMIVFGLVFNLALPLIVFGSERTFTYHAETWAFLKQSAAIVDPTFNAVEDPKPQNQGLTISVARYLMTYPPEHPYFKEVRDFLPTHWAYFQFGHLTGAQAKRVINILLLAFALLLAWRFRRKWPAAQASSPAGAGWAEDVRPEVTDMAAQWAVVTLLCALLAPLCWLQHLTLALPAAFLVLHNALNHKPSAPRLAGIILIAVCVLVLQRGLLGKELGIVMLSYHLPTLAMLVLIGLALTLPRAAASPQPPRA